MVKTRNASSKQRRSSRARNENRPWGWQVSAFNKRSFNRMKKDVDAGVLPTSCLNTTMKIVGRKRESRG